MGNDFHKDIKQGFKCEWNGSDIWLNIYNLDLMKKSGFPPEDPGDDYEAPYIGDDVYAEIDDTYQMGARWVGVVV